MWGREGVGGSLPGITWVTPKWGRGLLSGSNCLIWVGTQWRPDTFFLGGGGERDNGCSSCSMLYNRGWVTLGRPMVGWGRQESRNGGCFQPKLTCTKTKLQIASSRV